MLENLVQDNPIPDALLDEVQVIMRESLAEMLDPEFDHKQYDNKTVLGQIAVAASAHGLLFEGIKIDNGARSSIQIGFKNTSHCILIEF